MQTLSVAAPTCSNVPDLVSGTAEEMCFGAVDLRSLPLSGSPTAPTMPLMKEKPLG